MVYEYCCMAIVVCGDEILFTNETVNHKDRISIPKGHIEKGESHLDCAIRECEEETGVKLIPDEFIKELPAYEYEFDNIYNDNKPTHKTVYPLIFIIKKKKNINISEKNINYAAYLKVNELLKILTFPNVAEVIKSAKKFLNI